MTTNPLYAKLIEKVISERPDLMPYMELFQEASNSNDNEAEPRTQSSDLLLRKMQSNIRVLKEDLYDAMEELDNLAKALGACEQCWGEDRLCSKCNGRGKSGFFKPDKELFNRLILPALKKATWIESREKKPSNNINS